MALAAPTQTLYANPDSPHLLVDDVVVRRLRVNRDPRGILVETLRTDWGDCFDVATAPFAQTYYSVTEPWVARDADQWHVHRSQFDRFVIPSGNVALALYDARGTSVTHNVLNLLRLGEDNGDDGQWLVVIPPHVLHAFMVIGPEPALLLNYPSRLYDATDEGRVPFSDVDARLDDGRRFSWDLIRAHEQGSAGWPSVRRASRCGRVGAPSRSSGPARTRQARRSRLVSSGAPRHRDQSEP